jgi:hypothetical protein
MTKQDLKLTIRDILKEELAQMRLTEADETPASEADETAAPAPAQANGEGSVETLKTQEKCYVLRLWPSLEERKTKSGKILGIATEIHDIEKIVTALRKKEVNSNAVIEILTFQSKEELTTWKNNACGKTATMMQ